MVPRFPKRRRTTLVLALYLATVAGLAHATGKPAYRHDSSVPSAWYFLLYERVKAERLPPMVASRIHGTAGVALYESIQDGMPFHLSLSGQLNGLDSLPRATRGRQYHWPAAANAAVARVLSILFAGRTDSLVAFHTLETDLESSFSGEAPPAVLSRSIDHGRAVAQAVADWIATDGYADDDGCPYTPSSGPGYWRPTPPAFAPALQPCWGTLRPFVLPSGEECLPPAPPPFSTDPGSAFYGFAYEVYDTVNHLTTEQALIARLWADDPGRTATPPGHWIDVVRQISEREPLDLGVSAEAFARVGIAVADAFIGCWKAKYTYELLRPVSYVNDHIDPLWSPYLTTPPFPEYTSGHSTQSAAVAVVLSDLLGDDYAFVDATHVDHATDPPLPERAFASLREAAEEAMVSRLYGGIHYRFGNETGFAQGTCIGHTILERVTFRRGNANGGR